MDDFHLRVMVADDHPVTLLGIAHSLRGASGIEVVGTASSSTELIDALDQEPCDVLVLDYVMPDGKYGDGQALISMILRRYPEVRIVTITMVDDPAVLGAIQKLGVTCILSKSDAMAHIVTAVHAAHTGGQYLSPTVVALLDDQEASGTTRKLSVREAEIVRLFRAGYKVGEIATQLHRSKQTISAQKVAAMRKLGLTRDADLIRYSGTETQQAPQDGQEQA
ncbi:two component LuxR family transcriptional regulator [Cupriavidus basilensis OR16]|uniref:Two component LuxR family transcriptional regulator n=1 Tax=Cupriavidus basilensis OR16 TaxID=1127483 RepID=H1S6W2_9BURK|nr:response regulator [Cupriavidus basilensis]EHP41773.1 two component LuxR family transcriptional regulator [Cupriavidus basilensis OR16]